MKNILLSGLLILFWSVHGGAANAAWIWSWDFDQPIQTVSPSDEVIFTATIQNDATSTEVITGSNVSGASCCNAALLAQYDLENPGVGGDVRLFPNFFDQFFGLNLLPNESFSFVFLKLIPKASVVIGTYSFTSRLSVRLSVNGLLEKKISVSPAMVNVVEVPEPPTFLIFFVGLFLVLMLSRENRIRI